MNPPIRAGSTIARFIMGLTGMIIPAGLLGTLVYGGVWVYSRWFSRTPLNNNSCVWLICIGVVFVIFTIYELVGARPRAMRNGFAYHIQGQEYLNKHEYNLAVQYLDAAVKNFEHVNNNPMVKFNLAVDLDNLGLAYLHTGQPEQSLACRKQSLALFEKMGQTSSQAAVEHAIGMTYLVMQRFDSAESSYYRALQLARAAHEYWVEGACLDDLAMLDEMHGQYERAAGRRLEAIELFKKVSRYDSVSLSLARMAQLELLKDNIAPAIEMAEQSIEAARFTLEGSAPQATMAVGAIYTYCEDRIAAAQCLWDVAQFLDDSRTALKNKELFAEEENLASLEMSALYTLGLNAVNDGKIDSPFFNFYKMLFVPKQTVLIERIMFAANLVPEADDLIGAGLVIWRSVDISTQEITERIQKYSKDQAWPKAISALRQLSSLQAASEEPEQALSTQKQALELATQYGLARAQIACYFSLGLLQLTLNEVVEAKTYADAMVRLAGTEIHEPALWDVYSKAAFVFTESGFVPQAEELIHRAQTLAHEVGDIYSEIKLSAQLASIFGKLARYQEAAECLSRALLIVQKIASSSVMALRLRTMRAENLALVGSTDQALEEFISIFTTIDAVQQILDRRKYRIRFLATTRAVAEVNQAELLIKNQNIPGAFRAFEQNKLDSINELLWLGDAKTSSLFRKLGLFRISVRDASTSVDRMSAAIQSLKLKLAKPIEESTLWEILASLPQRVLIADYACTSDGVHLLIPDTLKRQICHHKIAMTAASLALCMNNLRDEVIESIKYGEPLEQTWQEFAIQLIEPLLPYLPNCELLCIIPHGPLNGLPFHAIPVAGRYLLEYCPIVYAPAVTTALMNRSETAWKWQSALVVGNPSGDLRHATLEAVEVAKILGTRPLLLNESKMKLWTQPRHEDIIHISSHGFFDPANPYLSGIVMADGILTIEQILGLDLDAQLVTLNACETGLSQSNTGRELIGLSNALSSNGAKSVIVSLWPVDQEASAILMKRMYAYLIQDSFTPAHALQLAQLDLAYQKSWCHPYYWAPFVVTGNW